MDLKWLASARKERRATVRVPGHELTVSCWGEAFACGVRDIGLGGAFIETEGRWRPGTLIHLVLQRQSKDRTAIFGLWSKVVRTEGDGMAVQFLHGRAIKPKRNKFSEFLAGLNSENRGDEGNRNGK